MKTYIQFYHKGLDYNNTGTIPVVPMCGSDGILVLDNRLSRSNMINRGIKEAIFLNSTFHKDIVGFTLMRGTSILDAKETASLITI